MAESTFGLVLLLFASAGSERLVVTQNGPAVLGATVTVHAQVYDDHTNEPISSPCLYGFLFSDDADPPNQFMDFSLSCSSEYSLTYRPGLDVEGAYNISVLVYTKRGMRYWPIVKVNTIIHITPFLNGELELFQNGNTVLHDDPVFLYSKVTARVKLSAPDAKLLARLGASFKTDWSFEVDAPCSDCKTNEGMGGNSLLMNRVWKVAKNAQDGSSFDLTFTSFHGLYVEARARLCSVVQNVTDLPSVGNTYGFFYRRFLLLDPLAALGLSNFTAELSRVSGRMVVKDDLVDTVIIEQ